MEHIVTGCSDCPFEYNRLDGFSDSECRHPKIHSKELTELIDGVTHTFEEDGESPDWCPIKKEPITISIKQDNQDDLTGSILNESKPEENEQWRYM